MCEVLECELPAPHFIDSPIAVTLRQGGKTTKADGKLAFLVDCVCKLKVSGSNIKKLITAKIQS